MTPGDPHLLALDVYRAQAAVYAAKIDVHKLEIDARIAASKRRLEEQRQLIQQQTEFLRRPDIQARYGAPPIRPMRFDSMVFPDTTASDPAPTPPPSLWRRVLCALMPKDPIEAAVASGQTPA